MGEQGQPLRILVVEDESLIAELIVDMLMTEDYSVVGPFSRLNEALQAVGREAFDAALLDIDLGGTSSYPVAEALIARNLPFVFLTGFGKGGLAAKYAKWPVIAKPFKSRDLFSALDRAIGQQAPK